MNFWSECREKQSYIVALRRELHRHPEYGRELPFTRSVVCRELERMGIPYTLNEGDDGVIGYIEGQSGGKTVAFRADIDALHVKEETGLPFASEIDGYMHACGHDAHGAMLLGAAEILQKHRQEWKGRIKLLFESGEEIGTGGMDMIRNGALDGVDLCFGLHIGTLGGSFPSGTFISLPTPVTAGKDRFYVTIHGKGGHSGYPHEAVDPIPAAAHIVLALQELHAREVAQGNAFALTIGCLKAGMDDNTIPDTAYISGNLRTQRPEIREQIVSRATEMIHNVAAAFRTTADVEFRKGSNPVVNDPALAALVAEAVAPINPEHEVVMSLNRALLGSDDFACYASRVPSMYYFLSSADKDKRTDYPHHNCRFDVDEDVLWMGAASFVAIIERLQQGD